MLVSATSSWLIAYLRLFRPYRGTQSPPFPDHDFPVMRRCAAPAAQTPRSFRMSVFGHEERFPPTRLSAGSGFRKETIAGMRRNGRDAPIPDSPALAPERGGSTRGGHLVQPTATARYDPEPDLA